MQSSGRTWEPTALLQGRNNVGSKWGVLVTVVRSSQILDILKGHSTGFAGGLDEEYDPKTGIKNGSKVLSPATERMRLQSSEKGRVFLFATIFSASSYPHTFFTFLILWDFQASRSWGEKKSQL